MADCRLIVSVQTESSLLQVQLKIVLEVGVNLTNRQYKNLFSFSTQNGSKNPIYAIPIILIPQSAKQTIIHTRDVRGGAGRV